MSEIHEITIDTTYAQTYIDQQFARIRIAAARIRTRVFPNAETTNRWSNDTVANGYAKKQAKNRWLNDVMAKACAEKNLDAVYDALAELAKLIPAHVDDDAPYDEYQAWFQATTQIDTIREICKNIIQTIQSAIDTECTQYVCSVMRCPEEKARETNEKAVRITAMLTKIQSERYRDAMLCKFDKLIERYPELKSPLEGIESLIKLMPADRYKWIY